MYWLQNNFTSIKSHLYHPILEAHSHRPATSLRLSCGKTGVVCLGAHCCGGGVMAPPGPWGKDLLAWAMTDLLGLGKNCPKFWPEASFQHFCLTRAGPGQFKAPHLTFSVPLCSMPDSALRRWPWFSPAFQCGHNLAGGPLGHFHPAGLLRFYCGCLISLLYLPQTDAFTTRFLTWDISLPFLFHLFYGDWNSLRCGPQACGQDRPPTEQAKCCFLPVNTSRPFQTQRRVLCLVSMES